MFQKLNPLSCSLSYWHTVSSSSHRFHTTQTRLLLVFGLFLAQIFCLVISPVRFAGVDYVLFSGVTSNRMQRNVRFHRLRSYSFITSDILSLPIQSAGGSFFASDDYSVVRTRGKTLIAGSSLHLGSLVDSPSEWLYSIIQQFAIQRLWK